MTEQLLFPWKQELLYFSYAVAFSDEKPAGQKRTSMLIRLAGRQAAVATALSLKATLAIQPRLADGDVADGRGIDPRGVFIKDDKVGRFACRGYTGEILAALPSGIGRHHP